MAEPTEKSTVVETTLNAIAKDAGATQDRCEAVRSNTCIHCRGPAEEFKDELSRKEYRIAGMCQKCQDGFFGAPEIEEDSVLGSVEVHTVSETFPGEAPE